MERESARGGERQSDGPASFELCSLSMLFLPPETRGGIPSEGWLGSHHSYTLSLVELYFALGV